MDPTEELVAFEDVLTWPDKATRAGGTLPSGLRDLLIGHIGNEGLVPEGDGRALFAQIFTPPSLAYRDLDSPFDRLLDHGLFRGSSGFSYPQSWLEERPLEILDENRLPNPVLANGDPMGDTNDGLDLVYEGDSSDNKLRGRSCDVCIGETRSDSVIVWTGGRTGFANGEATGSRFCGE